MKKATFFYDGDCYFCNKYSKLNELRKCIDLEIVNARENLTWKEIDSTLDLDDGAILLINDSKEIYQGAKAIDYLKNICEPKSFLFKIQRFVFSNRLLANFTYSIMKFLRKISLRFKD